MWLNLYISPLDSGPVTFSVKCTNHYRLWTYKHRRNIGKLKNRDSRRSKNYWNEKSREVRASVLFSLTVRCRNYTLKKRCVVLVMKVGITYAIYGFTLIKVRRESYLVILSHHFKTRWTLNDYWSVSTENVVICFLKPGFSYAILYAISLNITLLPRCTTKRENWNTTKYIDLVKPNGGASLNTIHFLK